ncbi:hypothetical protein CKO28_22885 [Rhodovibrio sodomensis]|uniref:Sugar ABC transporter ATP-binding protein n=1 Tax=Rhodovibrio sodomensis TaxID=1088 RepID=A0ABS1DLI2_9PROT|nr:hypothetical protein [Rhodovibrio sodomensis]
MLANPLFYRPPPDLLTGGGEQSLGIFLISHDIHDVYDLSDRFSVLKNGRNVGTVGRDHVTKDELLGMVIMGNQPAALADRAAPAG